jgi:uncharacterized protein YndB with AHSA1/START domain
MVDIIHRIGIKASPAEVYAALSTVDGIAGWWTKETTGESRSAESSRFGSSIAGRSRRRAGWTSR